MDDTITTQIGNDHRSGKLPVSLNSIPGQGFKLTVQAVTGVLYWSADDSIIGINQVDENEQLLNEIVRCKFSEVQKFDMVFNEFKLAVAGKNYVMYVRSPLVTAAYGAGMISTGSSGAAIVTGDLIAKNSGVEILRTLLEQSGVRTTEPNVGKLIKWTVIIGLPSIILALVLIIALNQKHDEKVCRTEPTLHPYCVHFSSK